MLPPQWRNFIALSDTLASAGNQSTTITTSQDHLRIPSICEVGAELTAVPYKNEVSTEAEEVTFSCYTDNNSRKKCIYNGTGSAWEYLIRLSAGLCPGRKKAVNISTAVRRSIQKQKYDILTHGG